MQNKKTIHTSLLCLFILAGCGGKQDVAPPPQNSQEVKHAYYEPTKFRLKPIIGSRNEDSRTVVDMGTLLKIWVAPYKGRNGILTSAHDIYAWARMPDFVVGEEVPTTPSIDNGSGMVFNHKLPTSISTQEVDKTNIQNDENIQNFVNGFNKLLQKELTKEEPSDAKVKTEQNKNDQDILNFIKSNNGEKTKNEK